MNQSNKLIVIVGGTRGIGKEIVSTLYSEYKIAVIYEKNQTAADLLTQNFPNIKVYCSDVTNLESVQNTYKKIKKEFNQTPYGLIYSAGISNIMLHLMDDLNLHRKTFEVNYFGLINWTKTISSDLCRERTGSIIYLSSNSVANNTLGLSAYCSSKIAGEKFMQILGSELGKYNISCNVIRPGLTKTEMPQPLLDKLSKEQIENILLPTGDFNKAIDTANAVKFLLGSSGINSTVITIDSGHALYRSL